MLAGVWQFHAPPIHDLEGPENDVAAMEGLMKAEGAGDLTVLRNDQVTRSSLESALHALGLRAQPGDWIVFYYSGHGAEAWSSVKGTRDGDRDQFVPLAGFDQLHQDPERFIVDKDFYAWLARYIPPSVKVLMITDTCHSGTMNRSVEPAMFHMTPRLAFGRDAETFDLIAHPGPQFPAVMPAASPGTRSATQAPGAPDQTRPDLPNVIFLGAAQDNQVAWEEAMPATGAPKRGFMTYALEMGLTTRSADGKTLAADTNGDGKVSVSELAIYLNSQVRGYSSDQQVPSAFYTSGNENLELFAKYPASTPVAAQAPLPGVFATDPAAQAILASAVRPGDRPWKVAASADQADFEWVGATGDVFRRSGDLVAQGVSGPGQLRGAIEKWNAIDILRPYVNETHARLAIGPQATGARYAAGTSLHVSLNAAQGSPASGYVTIFDLASLGTVQVLYPTLASDGDGKIGSEALSVIDARVVAPFGTDHVVAVITATPPTQLRALLRTLDNQPAAMQVVAPIRALLADPAARASLSIAEIYTGK